MLTINLVQVLSRRLYKRADDDSLYALSFPWMHTLHCTTCMHEMPSCPPLQSHLICCMRAMQTKHDELCAHPHPPSPFGFLRRVFLG